MSIIKSIQRNHFEMKERKGWNETFWFFDIHSTVIKPNYQAGNIPTEFYPFAKETLQMISKMDEVIMILYTCSHPHEIEQYLEFFKNHEINFKFVNKNSDVLTDLTGYGCYDEKPYINVLFDDKAGFDGDTDWEPVLKFLQSKFGIVPDKGLTEEDKEQLGAEIDNEGLGYWVQNYSNSWHGFDTELTLLLSNARESMDNLQEYLDKKEISF